MASDDLIRLYVELKRSIPEVSDHLGLPRSTVRHRLWRLGVIRSHSEAAMIAAASGKLSKTKGRKRVFTKEWKANLSASIRASKAKTSKGVSVKPNGYVEYTRGEHKGRTVHVVVMESIIGRRLQEHECVHHIDHNRSNNAPENLQLMTKSEHARHHAFDNLNNRERNSRGQFK